MEKYKKFQKLFTTQFAREFLFSRQSRHRTEWFRSDMFLNFYYGDVFDNIQLKYTIAGVSKIPVPQEQAYFPKNTRMLEGKNFHKGYLTFS